MEPIGPSGGPDGLFRLRRQASGFSRVVFLIREEMRSAFEEQVGSKYEGIMRWPILTRISSTYLRGFPSRGRERPWGTTCSVGGPGGLAKDSFAVINADDYYGAETFSELITLFRRFRN